MEEEKILITKKKFGTPNEYINDLTKFMDSMMIVNEHPKFCSTYIYIWGENNMSIRFPGSTIGGIKKDSDNVITEIIFIDDMCFKDKRTDIRYKNELKEEVKKFIGYKIVVTEETDDYENPTGVEW